MTYVEKAEERIKSLKVNKNGKPVLTTTQIRGLLSGISDIYNDVIRLNDDIIPQEIQKRILYLKVQFVYAAGRDTNVKDFIEKTGIIGEIDKAITSKKAFLEMERYMEALVAYHRYYGGKDE